MFFFFFFQAEDGIRDIGVTGGSDVCSSDLKVKFKNLEKRQLGFLDESLEEDAYDIIKKAKNKRDSVGGVVEIGLVGLDAGVGDPFFESLESVISDMMFSIPGVKGIEFGRDRKSTRLNSSH